jgi:CRISPR/Cas system endoribonuclease Cas6 (RAMP superfamily)
MHQAVAAAYGWSDLAGSSGSQLGHGFHATKQGERYTLIDPARRTVLDRLLALNHQRHEEEVKAGLHEKKKSKARSPKSKVRSGATAQGELIKPPQTDLFS